jgi:hypothetical protein
LQHARHAAKHNRRRGDDQPGGVEFAARACLEDRGA